MSKFHKNQRVLELLVTADESDDTFLVTAVRERRDGLAGTPRTIEFTTAVGTTTDVLLNEAIEGPMLIRLVSTFQA